MEGRCSGIVRCIVPEFALRNEEYFVRVLSYFTDVSALLLKYSQFALGLLS